MGACEACEAVLIRTDPLVTIYVALLNEGVDCWRPVKAERLGPDLYRIKDAVPDDEKWEFQPGEVVRCNERRFDRGAGLVAVAVVQQR
jgi:hypothetical protein